MLKTNKPVKKLGGNAFKPVLGLPKVRKNIDQNHNFCIKIFILNALRPSFLMFYSFLAYLETSVSKLFPIRKSHILQFYPKQCMASKNADPLAATAQGLASFVNRIIISHPCMVLRRQCQVHQFAKRTHLTPFTLVPAVGHIISKDGIVTLWKGSIGCGVLWALKQVAEIVISDVFNLPKNVIPDGSSERFWRHVLLKAGTYFVMTPFIVASFVETVRSNTGFSTAEDARILDVIVRGIDRLRFDFFGAKDSSRRFSIAHLAFPTVGFYTAHFLIAKFTYEAVYGMARRYVSRKMPQERTRFHAVMPEMFATMTSHLIADLICYPFETILHRLYIQGTRTLIDNLDTGVSAVSVTIKYSGFFDCLRSILRREGLSGFYMGIGAVILQYSLQFCVLNTVRAIFNHGSSMALHVNTSPRSQNRGILQTNSSTTNPYVSTSDTGILAGGSGLSGGFDSMLSAWSSKGTATNTGKMSPIFNAPPPIPYNSASNFNTGLYGDVNTAALSSSPPIYSPYLLQTRDASVSNFFPTSSTPSLFDPAPLS